MTPQNPKRCKTRKEQAANTRQRIVQAAYDCFLELGVTDSWLALIARRARVPHTLVLYHYPDRQSLLSEVVDLVLQDLRSANIEPILDPSTNALKAILGYSLAPLYWADEKPKLFSFWLYFYYEASRAPRFERINTEVRETGRSRIELLLHRAKEKGEITPPSSLSMSDLAWQLQALITGAAIQAHTEKPAELGVLVRQTEAAIRRMVGATG